MRIDIRSSRLRPLPRRVAGRKSAASTAFIIAAHTGATVSTKTALLPRFALPRHWACHGDQRAGTLRGPGASSALLAGCSRVRVPAVHGAARYRSSARVDGGVLADQLQPLESRVV